MATTAGSLAMVGARPPADAFLVQQLRRAGARPETVAWAAAHHRRELWAGTAIPPDLCEILAAADGEPVPR